MVSFRLCQRKLACDDALVHGLQGGSSVRPCLPVRAGTSNDGAIFSPRFAVLFPVSALFSLQDSVMAFVQLPRFLQVSILRPFLSTQFCCVDSTSGWDV